MRDADLEAALVEVVYILIMNPPLLRGALEICKMALDILLHMCLSPLRRYRF
jgi:hypothetical protein